MRNWSQRSLPTPTLQLPSVEVEVVDADADVVEAEEVTLLIPLFYPGWEDPPEDITAGPAVIVATTAVPDAAPRKQDIRTKQPQQTK